MLTFGEQEFLAFQRVDAALIGGDNGVAGRGDDPVQQARDFGIGLCKAAPDRVGDMAGVLALHFPCVLEHGSGDLRQHGRRLKFFQQRFEFALDLRTADRLAMTDAIPVEAHIIGMAISCLALRPASRQRALAVSALHRPSQGKGVVDVGACGRIGLALEPHLNLLEGRKVDQTVMLALPQRDAPFGPLDHSGIDDTIEDAVDGFVRDRPKTGFREVGLAFEEALHFRLRLEMTAGITLQPFLDDRGQRFVPDHQVALTFALYILVSPRWSERIVARAYPRFHAIAGLLRVLHARMGADRRQHMFDKLAIAVFAELDGGTFQQAASVGDGGTQRKMGFEAARQPRNIIDQHPDVFLAVLAQKSQQRLHAGPFDQTARHGLVLERPDDLIALHAGEFGAARRLTFRALALLDLSGGRDARIDDGFMFCFHGHRLSFLRLVFGGALHLIGKRKLAGL